MRQLALLAVLLACRPLWAQEFRLTEDFSEYAAGSDGSPRWETDTILWEVRDGALLADGRAGGFAVLSEGQVYRRISVEATLTPLRRHREDWAIASVCVLADARNFWHLALVESPQGMKFKHFIELVEMRDGAWLAQQNLKSIEPTGREFDWQYNHPYRLRIEVTPQGVRGRLTELDGTVRATAGYDFTAEAVTYGRAALRVGSLDCLFDDVKVQASDPVEIPEEKVEFPPYDVATTSPLRDKATGFFHVKQVDGIWWCFDPLGRGFYAVGTDHCRYGGHWCEKLGYAPYGRNTKQKYGTAEKWAESATGRLKDWGFNLLGAGGDRAARYRGLAHTEFISFGSGFAGIDDICPKVHWTGFPNVFSPKWPLYCDKRARKICSQVKGDPWLFGYFLDNELEWYGKSHREWGLFDEALKKPADHTGKQAALAFLRERYPRPQDLAKAWGTKLRSYEELARQEALDGENAEQVRQDKTDFTRLVAEKYFSACAAAIRKYDPNHMIIGCRFAGNAPAGIWDIAGKYCDIVTFNYYGRVDLDKGEAPGLPERFTEYYKQAQRPLMITEWSFPALDSGLPCRHGAGQRFDTQQQRTQAFEIFQQMLFALPFMVGSDFFMWVDEPALGISSTFPEDTNYGLVNEQDEPYKLLTAAARRLNPQVYERHARTLTAIALSDLTWEDGQAAVKAQNTGSAAAEFELRFALSGQRHAQTLKLRPGAEQTVRWKPRAEPGGHLLTVVADPEGKLNELTRSDNRAALPVYVKGAPWPELPGQVLRRIPVVISNKGPAPLPAQSIVVRLPELRGIEWQRVEPERLTVLDPSGRSGRWQLDAPSGKLTSNAELSLALGPLAPGESRTYYICLLQRPARRTQGQSAVRFEAREGGFVADNGRLRLEKTEATGDIVDAVKLGDLVLGRYNPLIWQDPGQNAWTQTEKFEDVQASNGPDRLVLDLTAVGGTAWCWT